MRSHRWTTLISLLAIFTLCGGQHLLNDTAGVYTKCEDVRKIHFRDRCEFVKNYCTAESRDAKLSFDYLTIYYCAVAPKGYAHLFLFWAGLSFLSLILFLLLGDTAEKYFTPTLTQISMQVPKMRPRFAGVTLLAFANGAPDLSATVNAIKTCKFYMSLGALTGAGMFVNCFVAGWIIKLSNGAKFRGASIRDVSTYFITVAGVLLSLFVGKLGFVAVVLMFVMYGAFVTVVFCADEWHEKGRPDFWSAPLNRISNSLRIKPESADAVDLNADAAPVWATYEAVDDQGTELGPYHAYADFGFRPASPPLSPTSPRVWANLDPSRYRHQALAELADSDEMYDYPLDDIEEEHAPLADLTMEDVGFGHRDEGGGGPWGGRPVVAFETENELGEHGELGGHQKYALLKTLWEEMVMDDFGELSLMDKGLLLLRVPFVLLQRATIPMTSKENYSRYWLIISMALSPLYAVFYFDALSIGMVLLALLIGGVCAAGIALLTKGNPDPPKWSFGTSWPIGAAIVALYGLALGVFWIDVLAGELVDLLHCAGIVTGIPEAILGLTVLAWGNSVGDFFTNTAIAKAGKGNMALTACYAGPVFNMLLGLGLGFLSFLLASHRKYVALHAQRQVVLGCVFLLLHAGAAIGIGLSRGLRLPKRFGYFSMGVYLVYLMFAVGMELLLPKEVSHASEQC